MSEEKIYTAICHTTCYWLHTLWVIGDVYEGTFPPNKHFSIDGTKDPETPPDDAGSDPRSNRELRDLLEDFGKKVPRQWSRKKLWAELKEFEEIAEKDALIAEAKKVHCACGFMAKNSAGSYAHERSCEKCQEIIKAREVDDGDSG